MQAPSVHVAHCPFMGSREAVWGTASCWQHGPHTQAALSCFTFCSVLGETRVSPTALSHTDTATWGVGPSCLARGRSPHVTLPGLPRVGGGIEGLTHWHDASPAQTVANQEKSFKLAGEPGRTEAGPVLCAQPCTHPRRLCQGSSSSCPRPRECGVHSEFHSSSPSSPKGEGGHLPGTGGGGSAGKGQRAGWQPPWGRLGVVAAALPGWLKDTEQQM